MTRPLRHPHPRPNPSWWSEASAMHAGGRTVEEIAARFEKALCTVRYALDLSSRRTNQDRGASSCLVRAWKARTVRQLFDRAAVIAAGELRALCGGRG